MIGVVQQRVRECGLFNLCSCNEWRCAGQTLIRLSGVRLGRESDGEGRELGIAVIKFWPGAL
jgi:hypothetical protein